MDSDLPDEDESSPSLQSESNEEFRPRRLSQNQSSSQDQDVELDDQDQQQTSGNESPTKPSVEAKWDRLKHSYNEDYVTLLRDNFAEDSHDVRSFNTSQHGAVIWKPVEKVIFFKALARCGKHDIQRIAQQIGTKSQVEVKAYIDLLQQADLDRQMFEKQTKNISKAEIPAAVEIDVDYERGLDKFADALAAYQDRYDQAIGEKRSHGIIPWLVTVEVAARLDKRRDEIQSQSSDSEDPPNAVLEDENMPHHLFRLSTFVELSERIFMNGSRGAEYEHWSYSAEEGEWPCMTSEVVEELHELVLNFLRRALQTTIFLAQSRIRAATNQYYIPRKEVKEEDVHAMLQVLNIKSDLWNYWTNLPRRAHFRVVPGDHRHGYDDKGSLSYDAVEAALSTRHHNGRLRSLSVASSSSRGSLSGSDDSEDSDVPAVRISREGFVEYDEPPPLHISLLPLLAQPVERGGRRREPEFEIEIEDAGDSQYEDDSGGPSGKEDEDGDSGQMHASDGERSSPRKKPLRSQMSSRKRRRVDEEGVEIYLQDLDVHNRVQEEHRLTQLLGIGTPSGPAEKYAEAGHRPKVARRSAADVEIWKPTYRAAWEIYDVDEFDEGDGDVEQHEIPVKSVEEQQSLKIGVSA